VSQTRSIDLHGGFKWPKTQSQDIACFSYFYRSKIKLLKALQGKLVHLRAPEPEDLEFLYRLENDTDIWQVSNTLVPYSRYVLKQYIETSHLDIFETKQLRFIIELPAESNAKPIGTIDLFDFDPVHSRAGVGILIGEVADRGKGYADDALDVLINYCFGVLKLHQLYCNIGVDNNASIVLFRSKGFVKIGEKKEWVRTGDGWSGEYLLQLINPQ
jgi:diamine N-acetyltransferase